MSNMKNKIEYNKRSSKDYGWLPEDFNCTDFNEKLVMSIIAFQALSGLTADGLVGRNTFMELDKRKQLSINNFIIFRGRRYPFTDKVKVNHTLSLPTSPSKEMKDIKSFVLHWDVCSSTKQCHSVLLERKLGVQFGIDNDGTIYQFADCAYAQPHAGIAKVNNSSIGVEISNLADVEMNLHYRKMGIQERTPVEIKVHGVKGTFLDFTTQQKEALVYLTDFLNKIVGIPLQAPLVNGIETDTVFPDAESGNYRGICNHSHLTKRKIDAGISITNLIQKVQELD